MSVVDLSDRSVAQGGLNLTIPPTGQVPTRTAHLHPVHMSAAIAEPLQRHPAQQVLGVLELPVSLALAFHKTCRRARLATLHMPSSKFLRRSDHMG